MFGLLARTLLPEHHLSTESKDVVKLAMGLIGTMAAIALGLLVATAKSSYDTRKSELTQMSANFISIDRGLAHYGPETQEARDLLRRSVAREIDRIWPGQSGSPVTADPAAIGMGDFYDKIQDLEPHSDAQRTLKDQTVRISLEVAQARWLLFQQGESSIPVAFMVILIFWLSIIFASFGLFAPRNGTVILTLLICALSVSGAIFLILEMDRPFEGLIQIPSTSMRAALARLGK
jgi:hypothetical protein